MSFGASYEEDCLAALAAAEEQHAKKTRAAAAEADRNHFEQFRYRQHPQPQQQPPEQQPNITPRPPPPLAERKHALDMLVREKVKVPLAMQVTGELGLPRAQHSVLLTALLCVCGRGRQRGRSERLPAHRPQRCTCKLDLPRVAQIPAPRLSGSTTCFLSTFSICVCLTSVFFCVGKQYNIVRTALMHNTMVCLPTGLGKTFIAATVMANFYLWHPNKKIIFMAPTKPLVTQQVIDYTTKRFGNR